MVADVDFTNGNSSSKSPKCQELNFLEFKKFFTSFLMRHDRAHLVVRKEPKLSHIHDVDPEIPADMIMNVAHSICN